MPFTVKYKRTGNGGYGCYLFIAANFDLHHITWGVVSLICVLHSLFAQI